MKIQDIVEANRLVKIVSDLEYHFDQIKNCRLSYGSSEIVVYAQFIDIEKYKIDVELEINRLKEYLENL